MKLDKQKLETLARLTLSTRPDEITCDEWLDLVAEYAEAVKAHCQPPERLAVVERHTAMCPECLEELQALLEAID